jgi:hypothetical protein
LNQCQESGGIKTKTSVPKASATAEEPNRKDSGKEERTGNFSSTEPYNIGRVLEATHIFSVGLLAIFFGDNEQLPVTVKDHCKHSRTFT